MHMCACMSAWMCACMCAYAMDLQLITKEVRAFVKRCTYMHGRWMHMHMHTYLHTHTHTCIQARAFVKRCVVFANQGGSSMGR